MTTQLAESQGQSGTVQLPNCDAQIVSTENEVPAAAAAAAAVAEPAAVRTPIPTQNQTPAVQHTAKHTGQQRGSRHYTGLQDSASLDRTVVSPDGRLSLEWLRAAPPEVASAFLMSVEGTTD